MRPGPRTLALGTAACALVAALLAAPRGDADRRGPTARLLGPLASALASAEWLRFHRVLHAGDEERAYAIAHRAIALDPDSAEGWGYLAYHFVFTRGSELETDGPEERRTWILAGLDLLRAGREDPRTSGPTRAALAFSEGLYAGALVDVAPWPNAAEELGPRALEALGAAARGGDRRALELVGAPPGPASR